MNLYNLPKSILVTLLLVAGVALVVLYNPPQSVCNLQLEVYKEKYNSFLFKKGSFFDISLEDCKKNNTPGGCYALFFNIHKLIQSFRTVDSKCHADLTQEQKIKKALLDTYKLFVAISWGEGPQDDLSNPLAWLSRNDVRTFCQIQSQIRHYYGDRMLSQLDQQTLNSLESANNINVLRKFSILSESCS